MTRDREAEYGVYSFLIGKNGSSKIRIVGDSTRGPYDDAIQICSDPEYRTGSCIKAHPGTLPEAWIDFAKKNRSRTLLLPLFPKDLNVLLARDAVKIEETCSQPTRFSFSRPGFNADRTQAVMQFSTSTGRGPFPGCGFWSLTTLVLQRTPTGWKELAVVFAIIS